MTIKSIINALEVLAPPFLQENYDNAGLIIGDPNQACTGVLVALDCLPEVVDEAIKQNCNLIVSHHPIVFKGLKKINGKNYVEQTVIKAIKHNISLYAIHTNLDSVLNGVSAKMAEKLGLVNVKILQPKTNMLEKLVVFGPLQAKGKIEQALFNAGAGEIGRYHECGFTLEGKGSFKPLSGAHPAIGKIGERHYEDEFRLEVIFPVWSRQNVLNAMKNTHPYEEIAYYLTALENSFQETGFGVVGNFEEPLSEIDFLHKLKQVFNIPAIKHTVLRNKMIGRVALCGGSGSFLIKDAINSKSDAYITADLKYHEFFDADNRLLMVDIGHFESEQFTIELLIEFLQQNFPNFAVLKTAVHTNPIRYFI